MIQQENHIFQSLRRDNHPIRQKAECLWDAHNIRITNRDDSTLLSITNERGPEYTGIDFEGQYVGHCVLGKYLVVFTCESVGGDKIYRIYRVEYNTLKKEVLFEYTDTDSKWNKGWTPEHPIQTLGYYETDLIQKVYWIDGVNQPRVINITKKELIGDEGFKGYDKDSFDFVRDLKLEEKVSVEKLYGYGEFSPGTIQYALSYYDKYGQESNIFYTTPLYYTSYVGRAGNGTDKVNNSFKITIENPDDFDYIRVYSIHRTSIDAEPTVKIVTDLSTKDKVDILDDEGNVIGTKVEYTDTGIEGTIADNTQLLYVGGRDITAKTMTQKDNTLFLGNITQNDVDYNEIKSVLNDVKVVPHSLQNNSDIINNQSTYYDYTPGLDKYNAFFKTNETYRLGVQVQTKDGSWSEPIFITDDIVNDKYMWEEGARSTKAVVLTKEIIEGLKKLGVKKVRACVVFPRTIERDVICQGVLCPTVYNVEDRSNSNVYARSSWFFRPAMDESRIDNNNPDKVYQGASIQFNHDKSLFSGSDRGAEIQGLDSSIKTATDIADSESVVKYRNHFFVDENIVTLHSPDIEFDTNMQNYIWDDVYLDIIGVAKLDAISGDINIQTKSATISSEARGFVHYSLGYQTRNNIFNNGGLISGLFYNDAIVKKDYKFDKIVDWLIYPWHRTGSLNNDTNRTDGAQTSILSKKVISNLKFFSENVSINKELEYNITTPQLFMSNELDILKLSPNYLKKDVVYMGNTDILLTSDNYRLYYGDSVNSRLGTTIKELDRETVNLDIDDTQSALYKSNIPVRIKYKSQPHLMFSLKGESNDMLLLPKWKDSQTDYTEEDYTLPDWVNGGSDDGSNNDKFYMDGTISFLVSPDTAFNYDAPNTAFKGTYLIQGGNRVIALYKAISSSSGFKWSRIKSSDISGKLILKIQKGYTGLLFTKNSSEYKQYTFKTFGLTDDNFEGTKYIGPDRYYEITIDEKGFITEDTVNEITNVPENGIPVDDETRAPLSLKLKRKYFSFKGLDKPTYLLIGELKHRNVINKFGGKSEEAKKSNLWIPAGDPVLLEGDELRVPYQYGDTWYARYDCLKTYPFTKEDENQIVEIGSFMCETRVNIDGRWDRNRGQLSNLNMSPENFNLMNEVYSQKDNFFNYRMLDKDFYKQNVFANQIIWSKTKIPGEDVDTWTNVTLASSLDLDGERGKVTSIQSFNEGLFCLQDKAINQILFNSRVQIQASDGIPIEIANNGKVEGYRVINNNIGCQNKWSVVNTPDGLFFIDDYTDTIWGFNGQLTNMSESLGVKWWSKENHSNKEWTPYGTDNNIRTFYDPSYNDIYFTPGSDKDALCYSFTLGGFMSQFSYGGTQAMFPFKDKFMSLRHTGEGLKLYTNFTGKYNDFFGEVKNWDFTFISNDNPNITKIFDTVELNTDHWKDDNLENTSPENTFPMNYIKIHNEYQNSYAKFDVKNMRRKFRIWRGLIPRNEGTRQRIRNPWSMITLGWDNKLSEDKNNKAIIHDVSVKYTV